MRPGAVDRVETSTERRFPWRFALTASLLMLVSVALIWLLAVPVGSGVCPAIDPPPTNCLSAYRAGSGLIATIVVAGLWAVTIAIALALRTHVVPTYARACIVLLALAPFVTYAAVAWSPGFTLMATTPAPPTDDPVGQWGEIREQSAYLTIHADGTVTGSDGCNGMGGTWSVVGGVIEFSDMLTTVMMCPPHDSGLGGPLLSAIAKEGRIFLLDTDGSVSGVLPRVTDEEAARR